MIAFQAFQLFQSFSCVSLISSYCFIVFHGSVELSNLDVVVLAFAFLLIAGCKLLEKGIPIVEAYRFDTFLVFFVLFCKSLSVDRNNHVVESL
jgi:hypothetical protein